MDFSSCSKICSICNKNLLIEKFQLRKDTGKFRTDCKDCCKKRNNKFYHNNKEKCRLKQKAYYQNNKIQVLQHQKEYYNKNIDARRIASKKYQKNNPKQHLKANRKYRRKNKQLITFWTRKRQLFKIKCTPNWVNQQELQIIYLNCPNHFTVDHIVPLLK